MFELGIGIGNYLVVKVIRCGLVKNNEFNVYGRYTHLGI